MLAVHGNLVKGSGHDGGQRLLQGGRLDLGVGGHEQQHRRHVRVDHAAALGDGTDANGLAADLKLQSDFFRVGISSHDGGGCGVAACLAGGQLGGSFGDALGKRLNAHGLADNARGGGEHVVGADAQLFRDDIAGVFRQLRRRGAGVGVAAVDNNRLGIAVLRMRSTVMGAP